SDGPASAAASACWPRRRRSAAADMPQAAAVSSVTVEPTLLSAFRSGIGMRAGDRAACLKPLLCPR
ncbi:MAG: hypothetical protein WB997_00215, partial [Candidatus Acidiferrales bacterium]